MAWALPVAMLGSSVISGLLANKDKEESSSYWEQQGSTTVKPVEPFGWSTINQLLRGQMLQRLQSPGGDISGYRATGLQDINSAYDLINQSLQNKLAAQGILGSPAAGPALSALEVGRGSEVSRFLSGLPLLERQLRNEDLESVLRYWAMRPLGQQTLSQTSGTGTGTATMSSGGGAAGAFSSMGSMLGWMYGMGMLGGNTGNTAATSGVTSFTPPTMFLPGQS
jgi:hypothetical protein